MTAISDLIQFFSELANRIIVSPDFQNFGLLILFLWGALPTSIPVAEVITVPLFGAGVSPVVLVLVSTSGVTVGNYLLYLLGRGAFRVIKGKHKEEAQAEHLLHKYRFPVFLAVPFMLIVGDIIVGIAGFERIGFKKILPFLIVGELIRQTLGIFIVMGILKLPSFLNF